MKKLIVLFSAVLFFVSFANAASPWVGEYELWNEAKITRTPHGVLVEPNGATLRNITGTRRSFFSPRGIALQDVNLSMEMEEPQFRHEVSKLGMIKAKPNPTNQSARRLRGRPARPVKSSRPVKPAHPAKSSRPVKSSRRVKSVRSGKPSRAASKKQARAGSRKPPRLARSARPARRAHPVKSARAVSKRPRRNTRKEPARNANKRSVGSSKKRNARSGRKNHMSRGLRRTSARR